MQLYMYINFNYSDFGFSVPDSRILDSGPDSVFQISDFNSGFLDLGLPPVLLSRHSIGVPLQQPLSQIPTTHSHEG